MATQMTKREQLLDLRQKAARRKRRIIMDNDGDDAVYHTRVWTPEAFLNCRTAGLVGTQVDTVMYAAWNLGGVWSVHRTNVGEVFTCTAKGFGNNTTGALVKQETDPLKLIVDFCRSRDLEVFYSKRMNDMHDSNVRAWYHPYVRSKFKTAHPEYLMGSAEDPPACGGWAALNYGRREVRDFVFRFVRDVCDNYDIDGVQLDFLRNPILFSKHTRAGQPVGQRELNLMTGLVRRIRRMMDNVALRRGRPMLLAVRVPDSVGFCRLVGIDIETWLQGGLVDLLLTTCIFRLNPWKVSVDLGHQYAVPVYPCLSETRHRGEAGTARASAAAYRARAMNVWDAGADGIGLFNYFNYHGPHSSLLHELGDPKTLDGLDKVYTTHARSISTSYCVPDGERFATLSPLTQECPRELRPGQTEEVELHVGEDLGRRARRGVPTLSLRLHAPTVGRASDLVVRVNGRQLRNGKKVGEWLEFPMKPCPLRKGANQFRLTLKPSSRSRVTLDDLLLWARH